MRYAAIVACACYLAIGSVTEGKVPGDVAGSRYDIGRVETIVPADKADTLIIYSATWCAPCQKMKPMLAKLRSQGYRVVSIDTDTHTSKQKMTAWEKASFLEFEPKKVPTLYWYNSRIKETIGVGHAGSTITTSKIKERLWKKSSSTGSALERLP